jgi:flavin reductase (DIM6/NTAB) family NADH-FMN oxidoreductase RutF
MENTLSVLPGELDTGALHGYLLGAVGPRPIAFASTVDAGGRPNLSPFSFFNVFSTNPPLLVFSPSRRVRDNSTKHTLDNVLATGEVVINVVDYGIVQQASLASTEYAEGENEFIKAGLTMQPSDLVKPFRVAESPVQFECKVQKVEAMGRQGGAGNLVFAEILKVHIKRHVLDGEGRIDPYKIDLVARMGGNWYSRAREGLFEVPKPLSSRGMGIDQIPEHIRHSTQLSGNDLGKLGNVEKLPDAGEVSDFIASDKELRDIIRAGDEARRYERARQYLSNDEVIPAWMLLLAKK